MFKIALRNLKENKLRSILTSIGVILSVALMLGVGILNESILTNFENMLMQTSGKADITVTSYNGFTTRQKALIDSIGDIQTKSYTYRYSTKTETPEGQTETLSVNGIDIDQDRRMKDYSISEGTYFSENSILSRQALIGISSAQKLGLSIDDFIDIKTESGLKRYKIIGILEKKGAGISISGVSIYVPLKALQKDAGMLGYINTVDIDIGDDPKLITTMEDKLRADLGEGVEITNMSTNLEINQKSMESMKFGLNIILIVIFFVSSFLVYNTFVVIVFERMKILGVLRTLGMSRKQAVRMVLAEGVTIGLVGTLAGLFLGLLAGKGLISLVDLSSGGEKVTFSLPVSSLVFASIVGIAMPIVSAYIPARKSRKISPVASLKPNDFSIANTSKNGLTGNLKTVLGIIFIFVNLVIINLPDEIVSGDAAYMVMPVVVILLFLGIIFVVPFLIEISSKFLTPLLRFLFGMEGKLAGRNLVRNKGRTSVVISVIIIGVMVSIGFNGLFNSFRNSVADFVDKNLSYDISVNGNFDEFSNITSRISQIKQIEYVDEYTAIRCEEFKDANSGFKGQVYGIDPNVYRKVGSFDLIEGEEDSIFEKLESEKDTGLIGQYIAQSYGIGIGDFYRFKLGDKTVRIRVIGVINSYTESGRIIYVSENTLEKVLNNKSTDEIIVKTSADADVDLVISRIKNLFPKDGISLFTISQIKQNWKDNIVKGTGMFDAVNYIIVFTVLMGLANTLVMGVYERKREIGILRSIGANLKQIKRMVFFESIVIVIVSIALGIAGGLFFTNLTTAGMAEASGFSLGVYYPVTFIVLISAVVFACSVTAAMYPANLAARATVVESIKSE